MSTKLGALLLLVPPVMHAELRMYVANDRCSNAYTESKAGRDENLTRHPAGLKRQLLAGDAPDVLKSLL